MWTYSFNTKGSVLITLFRSSLNQNFSCIFRYVFLTDKIPRAAHSCLTRTLPLNRTKTCWIISPYFVHPLCSDHRNRRWIGPVTPQKAPGEASSADLTPSPTPALYPLDCACLYIKAYSVLNLLYHTKKQIDSFSVPEITSKSRRDKLRLHSYTSYLEA